MPKRAPAELISFRLPTALLKAVDTEAERQYSNRTATLIKIIAAHYSKKNGTKKGSK